MPGPTAAQVLREFESLRAPKASQIESEFGVRVAPAEEPLPEVEQQPGLDPYVLQRRVGQLAFEHRQPLTLPSPEDLRALTVGGLSTAGEIAGTVVTRAPRVGGAVGSGVGGFAGSLMSELFDPTKRPLAEAAETAAVSAAVTAGASAVVAGAKHLIGKPDEAAKSLIAAAKRKGKLPTAAEALPDSTLLANAQSIGQADMMYGRHVTDALQKSRGRMTTEIRQWLESYLETRGLAKQGFANYDNLVRDSIGSEGVAPISDHLFVAAGRLTGDWKNLRLDPKLDSTLIPKIEQGLAAIKASKPTPRLSLAEIQAIEDRFRAAAIEAKTPAAAGKKIAGMSYSDAYERFAREADEAMDAAIDVEIKSGRMPVQVRAELEGARALWKEWKSGELMLKKLKTEFEVSGQRGGPLTAESVFGALRGVLDDVSAKRVSQTQRDNLGRIGRAIALAEKVEKTKAFTWVVRAGQLGLLIGASALSPSAEAGIGSGAFILLAPATLAKLTTSKRTVAWLLRGMQTEAGTAAAVRATRQLALAAFREGVFPPERAGFAMLEQPTTVFSGDLPDSMLLRPRAVRPAPQRNPAMPGVNPSFLPPGTPPATLVPPRFGAPRG